MSADQVRTFHISDVLSITTERLVSTRRMDGVYDILGFMTGESLFSHQLTRASDACKPVLLQQHPFLAEIDASVVNGENWQEWLKQQVEKYGETLAVMPLDGHEYQPKNPLVELAEMTRDDQQIEVVVASEPNPIDE